LCNEKNATQTLGYLGSKLHYQETSESKQSSCWSLAPRNEFLKKNDWLFIKDEKLGCSTCKKVASLGVKKIWE
jgi:hypothetical protein